MKIFCTISCMLFSALTVLLVAQEAHSPVPVKERIETLLSDSLLQKGMTGISIIDAARGKVLYEQHSDNYFPPASTMKLVTTAGALFLLQPEFSFSTSILTNGSVKGNTLMGDLIIHGKGDPTLTISDLDEIAQQLAIASISGIKGDVVFDDSYFDTIPYGTGWMWDDLQYGFSAPISALSVNRNTIDIYLTPGNADGESPHITIAPAMAPVIVKNLATTGEGKDISVTATLEDGTNVITVSGSLPAGKGIQRYTRSIHCPSRFTAVLFSEALRRQHITFTGTVRRAKKTIATVDTLFIHRSEPLLKMLYDLDKYSSNFIAEHILKTIGAEVIGTPGTSEKGIQAIITYLREHSIVSDSIIQNDGSGLSRYNLITPGQVTSILHYLYYSFACGPELMTVLPVSGADGTLRARMDDAQMNRRVRAKTGTMTHVSSLSGYCATASGRILIFSIMMKDFPTGACHVRAIQDSIIATLIEHF